MGVKTLDKGGRSGVDGDAVENRVVMEDLLKRHLNKDLRERRE